MAVLERLRVRAGLLLAIVIGLALLAFVLSDFLDSSGSLFTRSKFEIAEVSGKSVPYTEYETKVKELVDIQKIQSGQESLNEETVDQIRSVTWENMIQDMLLEKQYGKIGLDVSAEELGNMIQGENPHPFISQIFTDQQTGILNRPALNAFLQRIKDDEVESEETRFYLYVENEIYRQRKNIKYNNLVRKGLYATTFETEKQNLENSRTADLNFIVQRFSTISDSAIRVSDADISKYYKEHINLFKQKESRDIRYVSYEVVPSQADFQAAEQWINQIRPEFEAAEDIENFVIMESDLSFDEKNYGAGELPDTLDDVLFNAAKGASFGPYFMDNSYRISRLANIKYLPDSVKARHILLRAQQANAEQLFKLADSLVTMIKGGSDFAMLAMMYSGDGSAQSGGDLGWFKDGDMVKPFNDTCFLGKKGDVKKVVTQYGIHVVQILDQSRPSRKVQIGTLVKNVLPSEETDHGYYIQANEFAGKNDTYEKFMKAVEEQKLTRNMQVALNLGPMDKRVNDLQQARQLVSWAYKAEEKDVSSVFDLGNRYVVATVEKVREEGPAPLADVRADVENRVRQQKKAELLIAKINEKKAGVKTIEDLGRSLGVQAEPVSGIRFSSTSLGTAGIEPNVIAAAMAMQKGTLSEPISGENGVYVISVNNIAEPAASDIQTDAVARNFVERNYAARANYFAYEALKDLAKVKDNRREFY
ncbi:MAG: SurA N-terminal domain-containing protein [Bacteroidales bacterium]|nr:SurA N-terminal domain-containing protein [Bacteroidales bacterium]